MLLLYFAIDSIFLYILILFNVSKNIFFTNITISSVTTIKKSRNIDFLKLYCLKNKSLFNWNNWYNNINITIFIIQFFDIILRTRIDITRTIKIENSNCKKQVYFVANSLYNNNVNNYKVNIVKIKSMYFPKSTSILRDKYNLDIDIV